MESQTGWDRNMLLMDVLTQVEEKTKQLEARLDEPTTKALAHKIHSTVHTAIAVAAAEGSRQARPDSPRSTSDSPHSENSDKPFRNERWELSKKRKSLPKWSSQVRVSSGSGLEAPLEDGYSWRKYGQKDILGAKYPRGYYRCTHRNARGCVATKQVQRTDDDPTVFNVMYWGAHTCLLRPQLVQLQQNQHTPPYQDQQQKDQKLLQSFQTNLQVKTEGLGFENQDIASTSFSFASTSGSCMNSSPLAVIPGSCMNSSLLAVLDNNHTGSFSTAFVSAAASESAYLPMTQSQTTCYGAQSELADIVSAATSLVNSPTVDDEFVLDQVELDAGFQFDNTNFLKWWRDE